jgi:hypothetical protein
MSMVYVAVAVSTVVGGLSAYRSNQAQQVQYQAQQQANEFNAALARQESAQVKAVFGAREDQQRRMARLEAGKRAAWAAQSGLGFGGSNADVDQQSEIFAELDALNIRYEGELNSRGLLNTAASQDYEARVNSNSRRRARSGIWLDTASAALASGTSAYVNYGGRR